MAYLNGKFTCFDPQMSITDDTLAMTMDNKFPDEFVSRAQQIKAGVLYRGRIGKIYLPECTYLEAEAISVYSVGGEVYLPRIQRIESGGLEAFIGVANYLQLGSVGNGLIWADVDPEQDLSAFWHSTAMTAYIDETQADYLDFAEYLLEMANEVELYDSTGDPIEV